MQIGLIRGTGLAQTWRYSLKLFQANLKNLESIKSSFCWAFWSIKPARLKQNPAKGPENHDTGDDFSYKEGQRRQ
jgi:hypothetical protein